MDMFPDDTPKYSHVELEQILRNVGYAVECGACMAVALTGHGRPGENHTCSTRLRDAVEGHSGSCDACEEATEAQWYEDTGMEPGWLCDSCYRDWKAQP